MIQELIRLARVRDSLNKLCVNYFTTERLTLSLHSSSSMSLHNFFNNNNNNNNLPIHIARIYMC